MPCRVATPSAAERIERSEIVRGWLESAARCECPNLDECPLYDDPTQLPPIRAR